MKNSGETFLKTQSEKMVWRIFEESKFGLTDFDVENINDLLDHSEWGIALELICTQLDENGVKPSSALLHEIMKAARKFGIEDSKWKFLETG